MVFGWISYYSWGIELWHNDLFLRGQWIILNLSPNVPRWKYPAWGYKSRYDHLERTGQCGDLKLSPDIPLAHWKYRHLERTDQWVILGRVWTYQWYHSGSITWDIRVESRDDHLQRKDQCMILSQVWTYCGGIVMLEVVVRVKIHELRHEWPVLSRLVMIILKK